MKTMKYILMAFLPLMALSCQDEWDEHYGQANPMASQESLWQALKGRAELSNFVRLVENVGYEYYFDGDRMFTLFVPTNDCLTEADGSVRWQNPNVSGNLPRTAQEAT